MAKVTTLLNCFLVVLIACGTASAGNQPIWLSPTNTSIFSPLDQEDFSAELGVWTTMEGGSGSRAFAPVVQMDSKGLLWIFGGIRDNNERYPLYAVWNYNPKTDQYRYVWWTNLTDPYNAGDLGVPAATNHPGVLEFPGSTIDNNDNIWFNTYYDHRGELWMFNTTSWMFVRMQGFSPDTAAVSGGANPGQPGEDVWPGWTESPCIVTDSQNNLWLLGGFLSSGITTSVWHFNTTSLLWTWISGSIEANYTANSGTFFGGVAYAGCDIDANDRVWIYGGIGYHGDKYNRDDYGNIWTYDTRSTRDYELEYGADTYQIQATVVSSDFNAGNIPPSCEGCTFIDRLDGTMVLVPGVGRGFTNSTDGKTWGPRNWVWLYSKSLKQWKHIYGNDIIGQNATRTNYREPGSEYYAPYYAGRSRGKNGNGDLYIVGGRTGDYDGPAYKDIWIIPQDQCSNNNLYTCDANADCVEELLGYSCQCKEGYMGDGKTCTLAPMAPVAPVSSPSIGPVSSNTPGAVPKGKTSGGKSIMVSSFSLLLFAIAVFC